MTTVITTDQAKQITSNRKTLTIVPYEKAVQSLRECIAFEDVKYWDNLSDAYAAWAKINQSDEVMRLARCIKIKAVRRMGELALELRPVKPHQKNGPIALLKEQGLKTHEATASVAIAKLPNAIVEQAVQSKRPPSPNKLALTSLKSDWTIFAWKAGWSSMSTNLRNVSPSDAAVMAKQSRNIDSIRVSAIFVSEWLDEFIQRLK